MANQATTVPLRAVETADLGPAPKATTKSKALYLFGALVLAAAGVAAYLYISSRGKESTDDAQVEGHISNVAARVPGQVKRVLVHDNQHVAVGDVLVELDDADYVAKLDAARADLAAANASL